MSILQQGIVPTSAAGGYEIDNSLRLNDDDSAYLKRTFSGGDRKKWTTSFWMKRSEISGGSMIFSPTTAPTELYFVTINSSDQIQIREYTGGTNYINLITNRKFRDVGSWYHIVIVFDTAQATASDRVKLYINGEQETSFGTSTYPSQNRDTNFNANREHEIGRDNHHYTTPFDGYIAEWHHVDGQALTPYSFGEVGDYGEWKPIEYTGTYGTTGFYLDFSNSGSLGADVSGNGNNWTPTNLAATDQMLDTPTNNFCTLNPLDNKGIELSQGNLEGLESSASWVSIRSTFSMSSGKYYCEFLHKGGTYTMIGVTKENTTLTTHIGATSNGYGYYSGDGKKYNVSSTAYGATYGAGDIIGVAFDADVGSIEFYKNNVSQGVAWTGLDGAFVFSISAIHSSTSVANFGQDSSFAGNKTAQGNSDGNGIGDFYYTPPTGYLALCTQNLPDPTVIPSEALSIVKYVGTDGGSNNTSQSVTGVGFSPDWVWIKNRTNANSHAIFNRLMGNYRLKSNSTAAESNSYTTTFSLNADGFTTGTGDDTNRGSANFIAWCWKANGSGVSNTDGSITSTVSANVDAGFSIVNFTGTGSAGTVGHGLSKTPEMIINKPRDRADNWNVYCEYNGTSDPETDYLILNSTSTPLDNNTIWNDTAPTSSVFTVGTNGGVNGSGENFINYCFHSVDGYSKVGSYTGNGSADGTFVYTGFKPAFVMMKATTDGSRWWGMLDDKRRNPSYGMTPYYGLWANGSGAESQIGLETIDTCANGFKYRTHAGDYNDTGDTYIYIAFAEHPFKHSNAG